MARTPNQVLTPNPEAGFPQHNGLRLVLTPVQRVPRGCFCFRSRQREWGFVRRHNHGVQSLKTALEPTWK